MFSSFQRTSVAGVAVFVVAWIGNPFPPSASGTELAVSLPVPQVGISADKAGRAVFHCPQAQRFSQTGRPNLPWQVVTVLLPPGADPGSVRARLEGVAVAPIAGHWNVTPAPFEFTWRDGQPQVAMPAVGTLVDGRDVDVYARTEPWPALADLHVESGAMREWKLTQVVVPLFQYAPASGTLQRISGGRLVFTFDNGTAPAPGALATATASPLESRHTVAELAVNAADMLPTYGGSPPAGPLAAGVAGPRMAIITTSAIQAASTRLADFVTHKQSLGLEVSVITEADWGGGTGDPAAENIRNWLKAHYLADNITYVLLIGDPRPTTGAVPMKMLYPRGPTGTDVSAPSDIYYADLTGNWDLDGDGKPGEYSGDRGAGGIDRFWEVVVGRIPYYGTIADLDGILQKTIDYQTQPAASVAWRRSTLLPMRNPDDWTGAHWLGEEIKADTLLPAGWSYHRVYESETTYLNPPPETTPCTKPNVTNVWKNGAFGLVLWWTHGSATSALDVMDTSYAAQLNNDHPSITFQCSCHNASPETTTNLAYTLLKKGAICAIGDTRVSWYEQGESYFTNSTTGPGMGYGYAARLACDNLPVARALYDLTMSLSPSTNQKWMNFCVFNVYGDPSTWVLPRCGRRYVNEAAAPGGDGTSWATAYTDLQSALNERATEVWVAAGTYKPDRGTGDRTASFRLGYGTTLYGGFAGGEDSVEQRDPEGPPTILSGDLAGDDGPAFANTAENTLRVVYTRGCTLDTVIDGFTIRGGNANVWSTGCDRGGGLYNDLGSSPTIRRCLFMANQAADAGGAMGSGYPGGNPVVSDCTFSGNSASSYGGAASSTGGSWARFERCLFTGNTASNGGAFWGGGDQSLVVNCTFLGNTARNGGGAIHGGVSKATFLNCRFLGNTAGTHGGALYADGGSPSLVNCTISGHTAVGNGGAIFSTSSAALKLTNCTVAGNASTGSYGNSGGLNAYNGTVSVANCIFWGNRDRSGATEVAQIHRQTGCTLTLTHSCVQFWSGSLGGTAVSGDDPRLADPDGLDDVAGTLDDDLRLLASSVGIDAGSNDQAPADAADLDADGDLLEPVPLDLGGGPRFDDETAVEDRGRGTPPIVDMGAYEGGLQALVLSTRTLSIPEGGSATFTVVLAKDPGGSLQANVAMESDDPDITLTSGNSLTFTSADYAVPRTVTLAAAADVDNLCGQATIAVSGDGLPTETLVAKESDDEPVPNVLYVDPDAPGMNNGADWAGAYSDLLIAMEFAAANTNVHEIRIAQGVYRPAAAPGNRAATFQLRNGLALRGGYAGYGAPDPDRRDPRLHPSTLSGDLAGDDLPGFFNNGENAWHVVTTSGTDSTAVLDSMTIAAGNAGGASTANGGGLLNVGGTPTIRGCTFLRNEAASGGGLYSQGSALLIDGCRFLGNTATGNGGGLALSTGTSGTTLVNCEFSGNAGEAGGGAYMSDYGLLVVNCTFSRNIAYWGTGGLQANGDTDTRNSIYWQNTGDGNQAPWAQVEGASISTCCVQNWDPDEYGEGATGADPLLVDPDGPDNIVGTADDDLRLGAPSPCIDAGDNESVPAGITTDLAGGPRFRDVPGVPDTGYGDPPLVDLGPYEYGSFWIADLDLDGDVDAADRLIWEPCANGPGQPLAADPGCDRADFDGDDDADAADFALLQRCYGTTARPPAASCGG